MCSVHRRALNPEIIDSVRCLLPVVCDSCFERYGAGEQRGRAGAAPTVSNQEEEEEEEKEDEEK